MHTSHSVWHQNSAPCISQYLVWDRFSWQHIHDCKQPWIIQKKKGRHIKVHNLTLSLAIMSSWPLVLMESMVTIKLCIRVFVWWLNCPVTFEIRLPSKVLPSKVLLTHLMRQSQSIFKILQDHSKKRGFLKSSLPGRWFWRDPVLIFKFLVVMIKYPMGQVEVVLLGWNGFGQLASYCS